MVVAADLACAGRRGQASSIGQVVEHKHTQRRIGLGGGVGEGALNRGTVAPGAAYLGLGVHPEGCCRGPCSQQIRAQCPGGEVHGSGEAAPVRAVD
eukprot:6507289-Prymnesium_polylepis.1